MKELKDFTLNLDAGRNGFSGGELMQGSILVTFHEPAELRNIKVQFYGEAICRWDSVHGSKNSSTNGMKKPKPEEVVNLEKIVFGLKHGETSESIPTHPAGSYRYDFEFNLPKYLPCSFESPKKRDSGLAYIRYSVTITITRPWKSDISKRKTVNINEIIDTSLPEYAYRPGCQAQKQLGTCFSDGLLSIEAYLDQICYSPEGTILISAVAENESNRIMSSVFAKLFRRTRYHRKQETKTYHDVVAEYYGERVLPKQFIRWDNLEFKLPAVGASITKSKRIRVDYFLRVGIYQLFRDEIHVDLPVVIGTTTEFLQERQGQNQQQILVSLPADIRASLNPRKEQNPQPDPQQLEEIADIFMQMPYTGKRPSVQYISALARKNRKQDSVESTPRKIGSEDSDGFFYDDERAQLSKSADFFERGYYNDVGYLSPTSNLSSRRASETSLHVASKPAASNNSQKRLSQSMRLAPRRQQSLTPTQSKNAKPRDSINANEAQPRALTKAKSQSHIRRPGPGSTSSEKSSAPGLSPRKASPSRRPTVRRAVSQGTIDMKAAAQVAAGLSNFKSKRSMKIKESDDKPKNRDLAVSSASRMNTEHNPNTSPNKPGNQKNDIENLERSSTLASPLKQPVNRNAISPTKARNSPVKRPTVRKAASQGTLDMQTVAQVAAGLGNIKRKGAMKIKESDKIVLDTESKLENPAAITVDAQEKSQSPQLQKKKITDQGSQAASKVPPALLAMDAEQEIKSSSAENEAKKPSISRVQRKASATRRSTGKAPNMSPIAGSQQSSPVKSNNASGSSPQSAKRASVKKAATSALNSATGHDRPSMKKPATNITAQQRTKKAKTSLSAVRAFGGSKDNSLNRGASGSAVKSSATSRKPESRLSGSNQGSATSGSSDGKRKGSQQKSKLATAKAQAAENASTNTGNSQTGEKLQSDLSQPQEPVEVNNNLDSTLSTVAGVSTNANSTDPVNVRETVAANEEDEKLDDMTNNNTQKTIAYEEEIVSAATEVNLERTPSLDNFEMLESDLHKHELLLDGSKSDRSGFDAGAAPLTNKAIADEIEITPVIQATNLERAPSLDEFEMFEKDVMLNDQVEENDADSVNLHIAVDSDNFKAVPAMEGIDVTEVQNVQTATGVRERRISRITVIDSTGRTVAESEDIVPAGDIVEQIPDQNGAGESVADYEGTSNRSATFSGGKEGFNRRSFTHNKGQGNIEQEFPASSSRHDGNEMETLDAKLTENDATYSDDALVADISQDHRSNSSRSSTHDLTRGFYTPPEFIDDDPPNTSKSSLIDIANINHANGSANTSTETAYSEIQEHTVNTAFSRDLGDENQNRNPSKARIIWKETLAKVRRVQPGFQHTRRRSVVNIKVSNKEQ